MQLYLIHSWVALGFLYIRPFSKEGHVGSEIPYTYLSCLALEVITRARVLSRRASSSRPS